MADEPEETPYLDDPNAWRGLFLWTKKQLDAANARIDALTPPTPLVAPSPMDGGPTTPEPGAAP